MSLFKSVSASIPLVKHFLNALAQSCAIPSLQKNIITSSDSWEDQLLTLLSNAPYSLDQPILLLEKKFKKRNKLFNNWLPT